MLEIVKFEPEHIEMIKQQDHDSLELGSIGKEQYKAVAMLNDSYTFKFEDRVLACAGLVEYWKNRSEVWAVIDINSGDKFLPMVRAFKHLIHSHNCSRIEATVIKDFKQAHRLVRLLGFELEATLMRKYGVTGLDYSLYARVK
jgi:hypothetical protein